MYTQTWLAGSNDVKNAQIWGVVDEMSGLLKKVHKPLFEKGEANKVACVSQKGDEWLLTCCCSGD